MMGFGIKAIMGLPRMILSTVLDFGKSILALDKPRIDHLFLLAILLGAAIGVAPILGTLPVATLSLLLLIWTFIVSAVIAKRALNQITAFHILLGTGILTAISHVAGLGIAQEWHGKEALFWNVDNRYLATLAHTISRFGSLADSLEYSGESSMYHAGPAWIAGSMNKITGLSINKSLFLVFPTVAILIIAAAAYRTLRNLGFRQNVSMAAAAIAINMPRDVIREPISFISQLIPAGSIREVLLDPDKYIFTVSLMLNSLLAFAVGFSCLAILTLPNRKLFYYILGTLGLTVLIAVKPQYFLGFSAASVPLALYLGPAEKPRPAAPQLIPAGISC